jgi:hypothetical protein
MERLQEKTKNASIHWLMDCSVDVYASRLSAFAQRFLEADPAHPPLVSKISNPDDLITAIQQLGSPDVFQFVPCEEEEQLASGANNDVVPAPKICPVDQSSPSLVDGVASVNGQGEGTPCRDEGAHLGDLLVAEELLDYNETSEQGRERDSVESLEIEQLVPHAVPEADSLVISRRSSGKRKVQMSSGVLESPGQESVPVLPRSVAPHKVGSGAAENAHAEPVRFEEFQVEEAGGVRVRRIPLLDDPVRQSVQGGNDEARGRKVFDRDRSEECKALWAAPMDDKDCRRAAAALRDFVRAVPGSRVTEAPQRTVTDRFAAWLERGRREGWFDSMPSQVGRLPGSVEGVLGRVTYLVAQLMAFTGHPGSAARDVAASIWGDHRFRSWVTVAAAGLPANPDLLQSERSLVQKEPWNHMEVWWACVQECFAGPHLSEEALAGANLLVTLPWVVERPDRKTPILVLGLYDILAPWVPNDFVFERTFWSSILQVYVAVFGCFVAALGPSADDRHQARCCSTALVGEQHVSLTNLWSILAELDYRAGPTCLDSWFDRPKASLPVVQRVLGAIYYALAILNPMVACRILMLDLTGELDWSPECMYGGLDTRHFDPRDLRGALLGVQRALAGAPPFFVVGLAGVARNVGGIRLSAYSWRVPSPAQAQDIYHLVCDSATRGRKNHMFRCRWLSGVASKQGATEVVRRVLMHVPGALRRHHKDDSRAKAKKRRS